MILKVLEVVGEEFLKISDSRWEGVFEFIFGMIYGVGNYLSRKHNWCHTTWQGKRMCLEQSICAGIMGLCIGICFLLDWYKIGNWQVWNLSLLFFILLRWIGMKKIKFCGLLLRLVLLKWSRFILSYLTEVSIPSLGKIFGRWKLLLR